MLTDKGPFVARFAARGLASLAACLLLAAAAAAAPQVAPPAEPAPTAATAVVARGLDRPVFATAPPADTTRLFILEQTSGLIRLVRNGVLLKQPFLNLGSKVSKNGGEHGLLGLAFHPQYAANAVFFVDYNNPAGDIVVSRYVALDPDHADAASEQILFVIPKPTPVHQAGMLAFGPDGMLYIATGDGGVTGVDNPAPLLDSLLGKLLRVDVDSGVPYAIPADNPFVGTPGALGEIWARGLRNPWRFSFDRQNGDLYIADVGESDFEEVNWLPAGSPGGANFGWNCLEGSFCTGADGCACPEAHVIAPIHGFTHDTGCAIIGGYEYRGSQLPQLQGTYLYADYCGGKVWSLAHDGAQIQSVTDLTAQLEPPFGQLGTISSMGEDAAGELYVVGYALGMVWKIVPGADKPDCDGDGISDADEIAAGSAFDFDGDGVPDDCELELAVSPIAGGQTTTLSFVGGQPGEATFFLYTTRGVGPGPCFFGGNVCLDLLPPVSILGAAIVGGTGGAVLQIAVPAGTPAGIEVDFQALLYRGTDSVVSNPVVHVTQ
jgi:glucose/arabinose dehydrogenase